jgi:outer membrane protein assembly factor BamB
VFKTGSAIVADLAVDEQTLYVASTDTKLYALNRNNGRIQWTYHGGAPLRTSPAVTTDMVYQYVRGRGVVAIDKRAGKFNREPLWVAGDATQFLAQDETNAYVRRRDNAIVARDKKTGEVKFTSQRRDLDVFGTNTMSNDGVVYASTREGRVIAVRPILRAGVIGEVVQLDLAPAH